MHYLALNVGGYSIAPPAGVPQFGDNGAQTLIQFSIGILITVAIVLALIFLIWNGLRWIMSEGDKQKVQSARQGITYAIIGLLVAFFAIFVINLVGAFFGTNLTGNPFSTTTSTSTSTAPVKCPDGSGKYLCGETYNTHCPTCSSDSSCQKDVHSIASCSQSGQTCTSPSDCDGLPTSCPAGEVGTPSCSSNHFCVTTDCHDITNGPH